MARCPASSLTVSSVSTPGRRGGVEARLDDPLARPHDAPDPRGEVVGERMGFERVLDHGEVPPLELGARGMQAVVHGRDRHAQKGRDVLLRAVVHVEERDDLAERARQPADGGEQAAVLLPPLQPALGAHFNRRTPVGLQEGPGLRWLSPELAMGLMPDDAPEPAREGGGVLERGQGEPGGDEGFLHDVLGVLQVAHEGQGVAEGHVLEAPGELRKRVQVAVPCLPGQPLRGPSPLLHPIGARKGGRALTYFVSRVTPSRTQVGHLLGSEAQLGEDVRVSVPKGRVAGECRKPASSSLIGLDTTRTGPSGGVVQIVEHLVGEDLLVVHQLHGQPHPGGGESMRVAGLATRPWSASA